MTLCVLNSLTIKLNYIQANITHSNSYMVLIPFLYAYKITLLELLSTLSTHFSSIHFYLSSVVVLSSCLVSSALMGSLGMLSYLGGLCLSLVLLRCFLVSVFLCSLSLSSLPCFVIYSSSIVVCFSACLRVFMASPKPVTQTVSVRSRWLQENQKERALSNLRWKIAHPLWKLPRHRRPNCPPQLMLL